jgi:tetratricopeptide (TPR) repeat protein
MRIGALAFTSVLAIGSGIAQSPPEKLIEAGHWKKARNIVEARLRVDSRDALANFLVSQIRNAFGDRESPLVFAEKAVSLDGGVAKYHRQIAEVLGVKAQHSGILQQLVLARRFKKEIDTAIALDPADLQALRDLMEFYLLAPAIAGGDKAKASTLAERIASIDSAEGFSAKARLAAFRGDRGQVEGLLRKAMEQEPGRYRPRIALANFYSAKDGANPEAIEQARQAIKIDRGRVEAYAILARAYAARGQWVELESILAEAENEVSDDLVPYYRAAEALLASNCAAERAARYLRKYLASEPEGNEPTLSEAHGKLDTALSRNSQAADRPIFGVETLRLKSWHFLRQSLCSTSDDLRGNDVSKTDDFGAACETRGRPSRQIGARQCEAAGLRSLRRNRGLPGEV